MRTSACSRPKESHSSTPTLWLARATVHPQRTPIQDSSKVSSRVSGAKSQSSRKRCQSAARDRIRGSCPDSPSSICPWLTLLSGCNVPLTWIQWPIMSITRGTEDPGFRSITWARPPST